MTRWDELCDRRTHLQVNASHTYRSGGGVERTAERGVGYLGCDFALTKGAYRITRIIQAAPWDGEVRSPAQPGLTMSEGDYLLAISGEPAIPNSSVGGVAGARRTNRCSSA